MRPFLLTALLLAAAGPLAAQESPLPTAAPEELGFAAERLDAIPDAMRSFVDRGLTGGIVTLVARRGRIAHWSAVGYR
ncbi:MAG: serine hydrolase, partial [Gemmatimonadota bacterium]|nr:serine hydrolase [Gemmatimonadota bacterium]